MPHIAAVDAIFNVSTSVTRCGPESASLGFLQVSLKNFDSLTRGEIKCTNWLEINLLSGTFYYFYLSVSDTNTIRLITTEREGTLEYTFFSQS